jgi:serine/threonine-protein kinase
MTSGEARLAQVREALGHHFAVEREIAQGGMATVYLARALAGEQPLAVKVMHPTLAAILGAERFQREVALVRSMKHPLIVPLIDSGDSAGTLYYVMPYIEGETLLDRMRRERSIGSPEALAIIADIAAALGYAHGLGVLHRDVKPENILLAGGRALVADFGLARAFGADYTRLTRTGVIMGTIHYMSPEQLREEPDLDQRADVYSLGSILYEMLTGEPPFVGPKLRELIGRILQTPAPPVRRLRPDLSPAIEQAIERALAKEAGARFGSMEEFSRALAAG